MVICATLKLQNQADLLIGQSNFFMFSPSVRKAETIESKSDKAEKPVGRPRLEALQPGLLEAIEAIASLDGAADPRRRSQMLVIPKTLNDLRASLVTRGFVLG